MRALIERIKQNIPEYRAYDEAATRNSFKQAGLGHLFP